MSKTAVNTVMLRRFWQDLSVTDLFQLWKTIFLPAPSMVMGEKNGLLRDSYITDTPEDYIQRKYHELNLRPRKCLGYKTPYEVYFSKVLHLA